MKLFSWGRDFYDTHFKPRRYNVDLDKVLTYFELELLLKRYERLTLFCSSGKSIDDSSIAMCPASVYWQNDATEVYVKLIHPKYPEKGGEILYKTLSGDFTVPVPPPNIERFEIDNSVTIPFAKLAEFILALFISPEERDGHWGDIIAQYQRDVYKFGNAMSLILFWKGTLRSLWPLIAVWIWRLTQVTFIGKVWSRLWDSIWPK